VEPAQEGHRVSLRCGLQVQEGLWSCGVGSFGCDGVGEKVLCFGGRRAALQVSPLRVTKTKA
jgi:hypothetical protein